MASPFPFHGFYAKPLSISLLEYIVINETAIHSAIPPIPKGNNSKEKGDFLMSLYQNGNNRPFYGLHLFT
jgi:hypothetical protein